MQQAIKILIVGTNQPIVQTIARLINNNDNWQAGIAYTTKEAIDLCLSENFSLVLIGAGITDEDEILIKQQLSIPTVKHYGGGSGLLYAEIYGILNQL